jgi:hypothetical protein
MQIKPEILRRNSMSDETETTPVRDVDPVPRYSFDLIEKLDKIIPTPVLPKTQEQWALFNDDVIRQGAYLAGRRSVVEDLKAWVKEYEDERAGNTVGEDQEADSESDLGLGEVLDPSGSQHKTVASAHVAAHLVDPVSGDRSIDPEAGGDDS